MKPQTSIAGQIVELIRAEGMAPGPAPAGPDAGRPAARFALAHQRGLAAAAREGRAHAPAQPGLFRGGRSLLGCPTMSRRWYRPSPSAPTAVYFRIADDLLSGALPEAVAESQLRARYGLTQAQLNAVLGRISNEGWASRRPGYGWEFSSMMRTPDALLQSYRLRCWPGARCIARTGLPAREYTKIYSGSMSDLLRSYAARENSRSVRLRDSDRPKSLTVSLTGLYFKETCSVMSSAWDGFAFLAGLLEICWAIGLKYTEGFTRLGTRHVDIGDNRRGACTCWRRPHKLLPIGTAYAVLGRNRPRRRQEAGEFSGIFLLKSRSRFLCSTMIFLVLLIVSILGI